MSLNVTTHAALAAIAMGDFENFLVAARPGGIEAQEKAGQQQLVNSTNFPRELLHGCTVEQLEQLGFVFGAVVDDLFVSVTLPAGWVKVADDHYMWSHIYDEKGRKRVNVFYKAAFYDRSAHASLVTRYGVNAYVESPQSGYYSTVIVDGGVPIETLDTRLEGDYKSTDAAYKLAHAYLDKHYPDWRDPMAYWD